MVNNYPQSTIYTVQRPVWIRLARWSGAYRIMALVQQGYGEAICDAEKLWHFDRSTTGGEARRY